MDDYLSLIKNPKAKSPRVPTSPLVANQRQSPSSPNAGSTSSLNLSSLNRPIASNPYAQPTNIFNPKPLSRRSSVASPLDQSNDSIRRSTPSFIMNTTSQIIPRPQGIDQSLAGSAARARDLDYDGFNRASQISRRSQISSTDRSPSFGGHNDSLRDSIVKISKKLDKKRKKIDWVLVLLGIVVLAIAFLILRAIFPSKVVYCDTGVFDMDNCTPCPPEGRCEGGELVECLGAFTKHKNQCVENYEAKTRFAKYRKYISDKLAVKKGEKLCNEKVSDDYTIDEVLDVLKKHFHHDTYLQHLEPSQFGLRDFETIWVGFIERGTDALIYKTPQGTYKTKAVADPPFSCKMSLLWTEGKLFGIWIALFIATVVVLVKFLVNRMIYTHLAKELYNDVLDHLSYWQRCTVKTLKREFEPRYPDKDFERLWHYVDELVMKGGRINKYLDYYRDEKQVQEFWALLY